MTVIFRDVVRGILFIIIVLVLREIISQEQQEPQEWISPHVIQQWNSIRNPPPSTADSTAAQWHWQLQQQQNRALAEIHAHQQNIANRLQEEEKPLRRFGRAILEVGDSAINIIRR